MFVLFFDNFVNNNDVYVKQENAEVKAVAKVHVYCMHIAHILDMQMIKKLMISSAALNKLTVSICTRVKNTLSFLQKYT